MYRNFDIDEFDPKVGLDNAEATIAHHGADGLLVDLCGAFFKAHEDGSRVVGELRDSLDRTRGVAVRIERNGFGVEGFSLRGCGEHEARDNGEGLAREHEELRNGPWLRIAIPPEVARVQAPNPDSGRTQEMGPCSIQPYYRPPKWGGGNWGKSRLRTRNQLATPGSASCRGCGHLRFPTQRRRAPRSVSHL